MSRIGMRDNDGDRDAIHNPSSFSYDDYHVTTVPPLKRQRRGQLQRNHNEDEKPESTKAFNCPEQGCPRTFSSRFKLVRHLLIHSGERRFECADCGRRFHRKDHLKNHLQVHNPNKILHECQQCQKTYCSLLSFKKHMALHSAEQGDLSCKLCGKVLEDREGIMHHLKVHTGSRTLRGPGERKYPCQQCDRSFFTKKDVKRHLVVHTGDRDFVCQHCPQRFGRKDHLVRHTKKAHNQEMSNSSPPTTSLPPVRKYEQPLQHSSPTSTSMPDNHHKTSSLVGHCLTELNGLISPTPVSPMMEPPQILEPVKPDPSYGVLHSNLMQSSYSLSSLPNENGQGLNQYPEPSAVSPYFPMSLSYPSVPHTMPNPYLNVSSSNNNNSDLLSMHTSSFNALSLHVNNSLHVNSSLPPFNQAF